MTMEPVLYPKKTALGSGIVGGIAGGVVMYGVMSALMTQIGMGANCFAIIMGLITGQSYEHALIPGITAHFLTSIAIGAAFGAIINVKKFQIRGFGKAIGLGIATGVIAYAVIFVPIAMTVLPPHMMDLMKMMPMDDMGMPHDQANDKSSMGENVQDETQMQGKDQMEKMRMEEMDKMMVEETQRMFPQIMIGSFVSHIAFGAALGLVVTPIVRRASVKSGI
ncbi:MAG: hypothetical protein EPO62_05315 [Candidatus Nitrosotenuis sp.]|nr:MAG: hypothetical protein EPO62_05315 [Candidatus Nitrosotenuis sp.]